jgi:hypothetical protein
MILSSEMQEKMHAHFSTGGTIPGAMKRYGVARNTACRWRSRTRELVKRLIGAFPSCPCGREAGHKGSCTGSRGDPQWGRKVRLVRVVEGRTVQHIPLIKPLTHPHRVALTLASKQAWLRFTEVRLALPDSNPSRVLESLVKYGMLEKHGEVSAYRYRITDTGRLALKQ